MAAVTKNFDGKVGVEWYDNKVRIETPTDLLVFCRENALDFARAIVQAVDESEKASKPTLTQLGPGAVVKYPGTVTFHRDFDDPNRWVSSRGAMYSAGELETLSNSNYEVLYKGLDR